MENHAYIVGKEGRQSGIEMRQFSYSDYLPGKKDDIDLSTFPQKKIDTKPGAWPRRYPALVRKVFHRSDTNLDKEYRWSPAID